MKTVRYVYIIWELRVRANYSQKKIKMLLRCVYTICLNHAFQILNFSGSSNVSLDN